MIVKKESTIAKYKDNIITITRTAIEAPKYSLRDGLETIASSFCVSIKKFATFGIFKKMYEQTENNINDKNDMTRPFLIPNSSSALIPKKASYHHSAVTPV